VRRAAFKAPSHHAGISPAERKALTTKHADHGALGAKFCMGHRELQRVSHALLAKQCAPHGAYQLLA